MNLRIYHLLCFLLFLFAQTTDSYGNEVTLLARPMPIEYVLVQVGVVFSLARQRLFNPFNGLEKRPSTTAANI